jgi:hypothetical protein
MWIGNRIYCTLQKATTNNYDSLTELHIPQITVTTAQSPRYIAPARTSQKRLFHYCVFSRCRSSNESTELFPSISCRSVARLHSCYLAVCLHVKIYLATQNIRTLHSVTLGFHSLQKLTHFSYYDVYDGH